MKSLFNIVVTFLFVFFFHNFIMAMSENDDAEIKNTLDLSGRNLVDLEILASNDISDGEICIIIAQNNKFDAPLVSLVAKFKEKFFNACLIDLRNNVFTSKEIEDLIRVYPIFSVEVNLLENNISITLAARHAYSECSFENGAILIDSFPLNSVVILNMFYATMFGSNFVDFIVHKEFNNSKLDILFEALGQVDLAQDNVNDVRIRGLGSDNCQKSAFEVLLRMDELFELEPLESVRAHQNEGAIEDSAVLSDSEANLESDDEWNRFSIDTQSMNVRWGVSNEKFLKVRDNMASLIHQGTLAKIRSEEQMKSLLARRASDLEQSVSAARFKERILDMFFNFTVSE